MSKLLLASYLVCHRPMSHKRCAVTEGERVTGDVLSRFLGPVHNCSSPAPFYSGAC